MTDGLQVALWTADPLVAGFLQVQLQVEGLAVQVVSSADSATWSEVDVVLWDPGPDPALPDSVPVAALPVVALCASSAVGAAALRAGCAGVVDRTRPIEGLVLAIQAVAAGLAVREPGWTVSPAPPQTDSPLTAREHDVLELLAEGLSNKDIGQQLFVSEHTVRFHVRAILEKLDATSRTQAVVHAARAGLLDF